MATSLVADRELQTELGPEAVPQTTPDGIPTFWLPAREVHSALQRLREEVPQPYKMMYDLTAIDELGRRSRNGQPAGDFTVIYHVFSYDRNAYLRLKAALDGR